MVCLTYVELYNNTLNDLLSENGCIDGEDSGSLKIHEHPKLGIYLTGSPGIRTPVSSPEECMALIHKGNKTRATAATNLNERSSRSHTVISLEIITRNLGGESPEVGGGDIVSVGKLNLVDLAGSERVKLSGASGQVLLFAHASPPTYLVHLCSRVCSLSVFRASHPYLSLLRRWRRRSRSTRLCLSSVMC